MKSKLDERTYRDQLKWMSDDLFKKFTLLFINENSPVIEDLIQKLNAYVYLYSQDNKYRTKLSFARGGEVREYTARLNVNNPIGLALGS